MEALAKIIHELSKNISDTKKNSPHRHAEKFVQAVEEAEEEKLLKRCSLQVNPLTKKR